MRRCLKRKEDRQRQVLRGFFFATKAQRYFADSVRSGGLQVASYCHAALFEKKRRLPTAVISKVVSNCA
jgi:hypothetical protein